MKMQRPAGLVLPLIAVQIVWWALMAASLMDVNVNTPPEIRASTWVALAGLSVGAFLIMLGFKAADEVHSSSESALDRAVYRFSGLTVVLSLASLAIFALATFMNSFSSSTGATLVGRLVGVYGPIVVAAGVLVYVLLQVMLKRKSAADEGVAVSETAKALAIGYSLPIVGTALAIILGLVFYDAQGQKLQNWSWVVIQAVIAASLILGTRFALKAKAGKVVSRAPSVSGAAGAVVLNYVLSIVFGGAVTLMSFALGQDAIALLRSQEVCIDTACTSMKTVQATWDVSWWFDNMLPAWVLLLLVEAAIYFLVISRGRTKVSA